MCRHEGASDRHRSAVPVRPTSYILYAREAHVACNIDHAFAPHMGIVRVQYETCRSRRSVGRSVTAVGRSLRPSVPFPRRRSGDGSARRATARWCATATAQETMMRMRRGGAHGTTTTTRCEASSAIARAVCGFVLYARDVIPDRLDVLVRDVGGGGGGDDEDDDEDSGDGHTCGRKRRFVTSEMRRRARCAAESLETTREALSASAFEALRPSAVVIALASTANRPREMYEIDFTRVFDEDWEESVEGEGEGAGRRAVRAFVPLVADCAPPRSHGLRAFVFMKSRVVGGDVSVPGYTLKRGFKPVMKQCAERRALCIALEGEDGDDDKNDNNCKVNDDDMVWYQANANIRAVPSSTGGENS